METHMIFETHAHYDDEAFEQDREALLNSMEAHGIGHIVNACASIESLKATEELMEKYPNLKMIAGMNEYSSVGAARAVKAAGAKKRIQVVGVDSSQEAVQLMENGVFKGLVVQKAFKMGYMGVKETVRMLRGKSYDKDVNSGCELVTPDNMYSSEIEKLLFPFNTLRLS